MDVIRACVMSPNNDKACYFQAVIQPYDTNLKFREWLEQNPTFNRDMNEQLKIKMGEGPYKFRDVEILNTQVDAAPTKVGEDEWQLSELKTKEASQ